MQEIIIAIMVFSLRTSKIAVGQLISACHTRHSINYGTSAIYTEAVEKPYWARLLATTTLERLKHPLVITPHH